MSRFDAMRWASSADDARYFVLNLTVIAATLDDSMFIDDDVSELEEGIAAEEARKHGHIQ
ncbi:hypothetical protein [Pseudarthrobacter sulfonivorans]|uniref:hypothetical protein n=1 Tax=Pseudarthrobacter sulfonivorans TaxID=121292 RepID=UPI002864C22B|nr:hypothetical protein [Pseudarthrobacter sulfonivorans]MDR6415569.1 hypothetical protein [Pseudarthrobacter sulfonivorans]